MVCHRGHVCRPSACRMGRGSAGHAVRPTGVLHRLPEAGGPVRRLGGRLSAVADPPECPNQAGPARHGAVVGAGRSLALCPHHLAAVRSGEPVAARHGQGGERGFGAPQPGEDRRSERPSLAASPPGLYHRAAAGRAMGARHGQHHQAFIRASGRCRGRLQPTQARPAVALLPHLHAVEPAAGAAGRCAARQRT